MCAIGAANEGSSFRCRLCGFSEQHPRLFGPWLPCPACGHPVTDVSSSLRRLPVLRAVVELVPESVARENRLMIIAEEPHELVVAVDLYRAPLSAHCDQMDKLRFILNREIHVVHAAQETIDFAINRDYGSDTDNDPTGDS